MFGLDGENVLLVASLAGADRHPQWYLNLLADPRVGVQIKARRISGTARVATGAERDRLWALMAEVFPTYEKYQSRTEREIAVVVIEPRDSQDDAGGT